MNSILNISEAASLALHTMQHLASSPDRSITTRELAVLLQASEAHLAKVLQRLGKAGLIGSTRGPKGGFTLGPRGADVTLLEVYEAIDGKLASAGCLLGYSVCRGTNFCILGGLVDFLNRQVKDYLEGATLAALAKAHINPHPAMEN
jgi:Rrf2 family protein